jgi:hypothetical protein
MNSPTLRKAQEANVESSGCLKSVEFRLVRLSKNPQTNKPTAQRYSFYSNPDEKLDEGRLDEKLDE